MILRTRFKKDIVAEFLPPIKQKTSNKVVIFAGGMPSYPGRRRNLLEHWSKKGYWVFLPRYRGSWESEGKMFKTEPSQDLIDVIDSLKKGFKNSWSGEKYKIDNPEVYIIGSSFGGAAALLAASNKYVKKVVALTPVVDWRVESKAEPVLKLMDFIKQGFGAAYRFTPGGWSKIRSGRFFNPATALNLPGEKIMIIHTKDDQVVSIKPAEKLTEAIKAKMVIWSKGGHLSLSNLEQGGLSRRLKKVIDSFFKK
ncbi:MAG: alpha/beta hydrolase family protein [Patescibacteria group bacterium]